jgi:alkylation response protein AidB-like acyl-CoA dehydrogenase
MAVREFAVEAMLYRTAGLIDAAIHSSPTPGATLAALEEFAIEASILKVASSEMIDYVVDENVQIHGGNGFVHDYAAERHYRDARVNRIFEGTSEINRLLIPGMLARRAIKGELPLIAAARKLQDDLLTPTFGDAPGDSSMDVELSTVRAMKKVALMVLGTAMQTFGEKLSDQQEVLSAAADIIIDVFASDSAVLRALGGDSVRQDAARVFVNDAAGRVELSARQALAGMVEGDTLRTLLAALRRVLKVTPINTIALRRRIADVVIERRAYPF